MKRDCRTAAPPSANDARQSLNTYAAAQGLAKDEYYQTMCRLADELDRRAFPG